jgi:hypothetical protein
MFVATVIGIFSPFGNSPKMFALRGRFRSLSCDKHEKSIKIK